MPEKLTWWQRIKLDFKERLMTFEALNGLILIIWGIGFLYYANCDLVLLYLPESIVSFISIFLKECSLSNGYLYSFNSAGLVLIIWGVRKSSVNRIKQAAVVAEMVDTRAAVNEVIAAESGQKSTPTINLKET